MTECIFDVVAEDPQEPHIAYKMKNAPVHKHRRKNLFERKNSAMRKKNLGEAVRKLIRHKSHGQNVFLVSAGSEKKLIEKYPEISNHEGNRDERKRTGALF